MIHSFLQNNAWFEGDIIVIHQDLRAQDIATLQNDFDHIKVVNPHETLNAKLAHLTQLVPSIAIQTAQFFSLHAIALNTYDQVLFCDSDLLFRASLAPLFDLPHALVCCGDGAYHRGAARRRDSFVEVPKDHDPKDLHQTFNAGFMVMDKSIRTPEMFAKALAHLDSEKWRENPTGHTDQLIFNVLMEGQQHIVDPEYNYVLRHHLELAKRYDLHVQDAKVLHFNGAAKPWDPVMTRHVGQSDGEASRAARYWNEAFRALLATAKDR